MKMQHFGSVVQTHVKLIAYLWRHQSIYFSQFFKKESGADRQWVRVSLILGGTYCAPENLFLLKVGFSTKTNKTKSDQILWHFWLI